MLQVAEETTLADYIASMSKPWVWGGAIEIKAFCNLFRVNVQVVVTYTGRVIDILSETPTKRSVTIYYNGSHFYQ
jgi:hypothetical protein